jgi:hypothetical protein
MQNHDPIIIAMGVDKYGEPDAETNRDACSLLARAKSKGRDGHIAKFDCHKSKVQFCEADGTVVVTPGVLQLGSPALYFLVHGSHGKLLTDVPGGDLIDEIEPENGWLDGRPKLPLKFDC